MMNLTEKGKLREILENLEECEICHEQKKCYDFKGILCCHDCIMDSNLMKRREERPKYYRYRPYPRK